MRTTSHAAFFLALLLFAFIFVEYTGSEPVAGEQSMEESETPTGGLVTLSDDMSREEITEKIGRVLDFDEQTAEQFHHTYRSMQWDAFNEDLEAYFLEEHNITEREREILLTHSTAFLDRENDILESLYVPGDYQFAGDETVLEVAQMLLERTPTSTAVFVSERINSERESELLEYLRSETELLPDLVPLPPQDIAIVDEPSRRLLVFTTVYYNKGDGALELRADPATIGVSGDFDRDVYQRIERTDGTYRTRHAGTFEWHHEHIHYHFSDFIEYSLTGVDNDTELGGDGLLEKSTFCIRDVSRVYLDGISTTSPAQFRVCGRERQGVSVGWGDAYFNTYVDQNLDVTELQSGTYRLTFNANPADRFDEITKENNVASADIIYNREDGTVEVVDTSPSTLPEFEHIHVKQEFE